jgi:hypothetical protein
VEVLQAQLFHATKYLQVLESQQVNQLAPASLLAEELLQAVALPGQLFHVKQCRLAVQVR